MATSELAPSHAPEAATAEGAAPTRTPVAGPGLARVEAVRGQGFEAVEQIAEAIQAFPGEQTEVMTWLHQNRGNDFVQHVVGRMTKTPAKTTKFPIVLLHGLGAAPDSFAASIPAGLQDDGDAVFEVTLPPYDSSEARAKAMAPQLEDILAKTGASKLNLIAWVAGRARRALPDLVDGLAGSRGIAVDARHAEPRLRRRR